MTKVVICICTCRHPLGLERLLHSLNAIVADADISVLVIDNDRAQEGSAICADAVNWLRWPLRWEYEPQPGISYARNHAVRTAMVMRADFIAFLDDDETASVNWLRELLTIQEIRDADAVTGPVLPAFEGKTTAWLELGRYFLRRRHPDGRRVEIRGGGGNCLLRTTSIAPFLPSPYNTAFALSGGEDTDFFGRFGQAGNKVYWADRAVVLEYLAQSRATKSWLRNRKFWEGQVFYRIQRQNQPSWHHDGKRLFIAVAQIILSLLRFAQHFFNKPRRFDAELTMALAAGKISAYFPTRMEYYGPTYRAAQAGVELTNPTIGRRGS